MIQHLILAAAFAGAPTGGMAQGCYGYGHGCYGMVPGPRAVHANARVEKGFVLVQRFLPRLVPHEATVKRQVKGKDGKVVEVEETQTRYKTAIETVQEKVKADQVLAYGSDGNKVAAKTWPGQLEAWTPVLISDDGRAVDAGYFRILKKGTLALVLPRMEPKDPPQPIAPQVGRAEQGLTLVFFQDGKKFTPPPPAPKPPSGPQPNLVGASIDDQGALHMQQAGNYQFEQTLDVEVKYREGTKELVRKIPVLVKNGTFTVLKQSLAARYVRAHGVDGKAIGAKALAQRLAKHVPALVSQDGNPADPYYLQIFKEGTIVLVPPAPPVAFGGGAYLPVPEGDDAEPPAAPAPPKKNLPKLQTS